jgi:hypothetical protein
MKRKRRHIPTLALLAALVAGSLGAPGPAAGAPHYVNLAKVPKPDITGGEIISGLEDFVAKFPLRQNLVGPNNEAAANFLADEAKSYGFTTRILEFQAGTPPRTVRAVEAVRRGTTKPNNWIAFVAHYDIVPGQGATIQGAYDDGSGTNMLRYFGKAFSKLPMKHSIALLWFDGEENGLLGSQAYADMMAKQGQAIDAVMGFDMNGIGYPAPYCICVYYGTPEDAAKAVPILEYVNYKYLKLPESDGSPGTAEKWPFGTEGGLCVCGPNIRNSDERSFAAKGYFSLRWAGMRQAIDYPGYHLPWDTVQLMEQVAGGRDNLEQGTENTFLSAYYTTFVLDNL